MSRVIGSKNLNVRNPQRQCLVVGSLNFSAVREPSALALTRPRPTDILCTYASRAVGIFKPVTGTIGGGAQLLAADTRKI